MSFDAVRKLIVILKGTGTSVGKWTFDQGVQSLSLTLSFGEIVEQDTKPLTVPFFGTYLNSWLNKDTLAMVPNLVVCNKTRNTLLKIDHIVVQNHFMSMFLWLTHTDCGKQLQFASADWLKKINLSKRCLFTSSTTH